jgi:hypothetical protein
MVEAGSGISWLMTIPVASGTGSGVSSNHYLSNTTYGFPRGDVQAGITYRDSIITNGGKFSENKNFDFDSGDKDLNLNNIETSKVLTYTGAGGAHMIGEEKYILSVTGEAKKDSDYLRCVFSSDTGRWLPPFCNTVSATSALVNVNNAQISTGGGIRAVAANDDIPAELSYRIAVTPDALSGRSLAEGTVKTTFTGTIMEARDTGLYDTHNGSSLSWDGDNPEDIRYNATDSKFLPSAENRWKDSTTVTGGLKNFQKTFTYVSGFKI